MVVMVAFPRIRTMHDFRFRKLVANSKPVPLICDVAIPRGSGWNMGFPQRKKSGKSAASE